MSLNKNPNCTQGRWKPWIEVKKSNLVKAGWGLFASRDFKKDEIISVYLGADCRGKDDSDSDYLYRFQDRDGQGGIGSGHPPWLGAHFVNDPTLSKPPRPRVNAMIGKDYRMIAKYRINKGYEIFIDYQWQDKCFAEALFNGRLFGVKVLLTNKYT